MGTPPSSMIPLDPRWFGRTGSLAPQCPPSGVFGCDYRAVVPAVVGVPAQRLGRVVAMPAHRHGCRGRRIAMLNRRPSRQGVASAASVSCHRDTECAQSTAKGSLHL